MTMAPDAVLDVWRKVADEHPELDLDLSWLESQTEKGVAAKPGKHGLTVEEIQAGSYVLMDTAYARLDM